MRETRHKKYILYDSTYEVKKPAIRSVQSHDRCYPGRGGAVGGGVVSGGEHRGSKASEAQITCLLIRVVVTWVCSRIPHLCVHFSEQ